MINIRACPIIYLFVLTHVQLEHVTHHASLISNMKDQNLFADMTSCCNSIELSFL